MSERSKTTESLRTVLDRIRDNAKGMRGRAYVPEQDGLPLPPADAPTPPPSHHDRDPGEDDQ